MTTQHTPNAHLIAAASDLKRELVRLHAMVVNVLTDSQLDIRHPTGVAVRNVLRDVEAAIAKAEGH